MTSKIFSLSLHSLPNQLKGMTPTLPTSHSLCFFSQFSDHRESYVVTKVFDVQQLESNSARPTSDEFNFINDIPANEASAINIFMWTLYPNE